MLAALRCSQQKVSLRSTADRCQPAATPEAPQQHKSPERSPRGNPEPSHQPAYTVGTRLSASDPQVRVNMKIGAGKKRKLGVATDACEEIDDEEGFDERLPSREGIG